MEFVVDKLIEFSGSGDEELRDISGLGTFRTEPHTTLSLIELISFEDNYL